MGKYLVIVESPTKSRTITSILGKDYEVASSMGHLVDLPPNKLSVDVEHGFTPVYQVISGKEKVITQLKKKAKNKKAIYLATDPDREGEAISWHIREKLSGNKTKFYRVVFHEITEEALHKAFKKPVALDLHKVDAQVARRVLDRVVGYSLSPILWKKIVRGLSAGRVQSIALKFIVEREKDILNFTPKTTFGVEAEFKSQQDKFKARLDKYKGKKIVFDKQAAALDCIAKIRLQDFKVKKVTRKENLKKPPPPYITSSLQQDAFNRLRFSAHKTMFLAQKLYEGVKIGDKSTGLITYMRTDSFHINPRTKKEARGFVAAAFGEHYLAGKEYHYPKKKGAQLAHEAIRPTAVSRTPQELAAVLDEEELKLYELIWRRFLAGFMKEARFESTKAYIASQDAGFDAGGRRILFEGYLKAFGEEKEDNPLPLLTPGQAVSLEDLKVTEHTTKPPFRYNDASLVKLLEEKGIGRPSTYAPIIQTLLLRNYARREKRSFIPTDLGIKVSDLLVKFFPKVINEDFTAFMEEQLDEVERGKAEWNAVLEKFYPAFHKKVKATLNLAKKDIEYSGKDCPDCQGKLVIKWSRRGRFLSCESFPKCRYAESITSGVKCPECKEGELVERRNRRGQNFYGCSKFPQCTYTSRTLPEEANAEQDKG